MHVLFVCTGNVCRSPIAERLTAAYTARLQLANVVASSAGTRAMIGHPMHPDAASVLERLGGDPAGFSGRQLSPKVASHADLILTMTRSHRDVVLEHAPDGLSRTFTIGEAATLVKDFGAKTATDLVHLRPQLRQREITDVRDPIGHGAQVFSEIGFQIAELLESVLPLLNRDNEDQKRAGPHVE